MRQMAVTWTERQLKVIESRNRNLLVSAAAGSGKTAVLVERIIRMISEGDHPLDIDQLLIMTFTNAAAAEMRERIGEAVEEKLKERPEDEHLWLQAALIPQAQITTIDSFCLNLIRSHYNGLDIDPAFRIGDEGELSLLRNDVMATMLEACYESNKPEFTRFVEQFGRGKSDQGIEDVIVQLWEFSQSHPWPGEWLMECRRELDREELGELDASPWMKFLLKDVEAQMEELTRQVEEALGVCREENGPLAYEPMLLSDKGMLEAIRNGARSGRFRALYDSLQGLVFDRLAAIRSKEVDGEKKAYVSGCRDRVKKAVGKCRDLYGLQSPETAAESLKGAREVIGALLDLAERFHEAYGAAKRERNVLDFNDLEHLALEVLLEEEEDPEGGLSRRRPSAVADELSRQYEEILVDEYQDSNYVQEALITSISRERAGSPNVFMVGDVKQSIYRFRQARPELFMKKYEDYSKEDSLYQLIELQQNFRSRDTVLSGINDVFYQIMTKGLGGIRYTEETALYPGACFKEVTGETVCGIDLKREGISLEAGSPVELLVADTGGEALRQLDEEALDYTARELEAKMIAGRIRELVSEDKGLLVWDKGLGKYRRAQLGDMVILLRSMSGWSEVLVNVLMNEGISARAQTRTGYFNTVEVETILSLLSVLDNPMQDIPLTAVLHSPIVGMNDEEMAWMMAAFKCRGRKGQDRGVYGAWMLWKEAGQELPGKAEIPAEIAASIIEKLKKWDRLWTALRMEARRLPIHELLYLVYRETGFYDFAAAMPAGETRRGNLDMLVEKAVAYEATSYKGLFHFVRYIEKLKKFDTDFGEASVAGDQENTVRIMSIHKSKGLEFPVVFLAGLGKRMNKQDAYGQILMDGELGVAADYLDSQLRVKMTTLKKQALKRRLEVETLGEELRVLYVAMTRAKEKLIMTATDKSLEKKLEKWGTVPLVEGQIPCTILNSAVSCLDWLLMAAPAIPKDHMKLCQIQVRDLIGQEVSHQMLRQMTKEDLLNLDVERVYDKKFHSDLEKAFQYSYRYQWETGLYAMVSVSELKKQSQIGLEEEALGTEAERFEGAGPEALWKLGREGYKDADAKTPESQGSSRGALRGTAYHAALERLFFPDIHSREDTIQAIRQLLDSGYLDQKAYELINPSDIWIFLSGPLGRRMAKAQAEGRCRREQQFIMGVPAREVGKGDSEELVLIQGIIDAYLEEPEGLVLIDYKTDHVPAGLFSGAKLLADRYRIQLDYYARALTQLTGKKVKERIIYSMALQQSIEV